MSAQSSVQRDARRYALIHLRNYREYRRDRTAVELLNDAANACARVAAQYVVAGDMPEARRNAAAYRLLADSSARLAARKSRELDAKNAALAAVHGIAAGDDVRVARAGQEVPAGTVVTIENVSGDILWVTFDGERRIVWASDVERVDEPAVEAPMPHDDERDEELPEPPYADQIIASGMFTDTQAFALASAASAADREGRDPEAAVADLVRAWDYGEVSA